LFLGLAVLAKGPAALILCGGGVALWALFTSRWRDTLRLLRPAAIAAFCLTALPWYVLCAYRNPDFFHVFIIEHNFKRFLTPEFQHLQPFWFYGEILLIAFLPWTAAFLCSRIAGTNRLRRGSLGAPTLFLLSWSLFCILFFTISRSKLPGYILPAIPPLGLILARSCTLLAQSKRSRQAVGVATVIFAAIFGAAFYAVLTNPDHILKRVTPFAPIIGLALLLFTLTNLFFGVFLLFNRRSAALISATLPFFAYFWLFDELAKFTPLSIQSPRYAAQQIAAQQIPVAALRVGGLKRSTLYGLNFYLRTDLQEWDRDTSGDVYVLTDGPMPCPLQMTQPSCEDLWEEIDRIGGSLELLHLKPRTSDPHAR
jgi:4-amino-4-deoxy-L-arabinose transferase-like glycosyltransferase